MSNNKKNDQMKPDVCLRRKNGGSPYSLIMKLIMHLVIIYGIINTAHTAVSDEPDAPASLEAIQARLLNQDDVEYEMEETVYLFGEVVKVHRQHWWRSQLHGIVRLEFPADSLEGGLDPVIMLVDHAQGRMYFKEGMRVAAAPEEAVSRALQSDIMPLMDLTRWKARQVAVDSMDGRDLHIFSLSRHDVTEDAETLIWIDPDSGFIYRKVLRDNGKTTVTLHKNVRLNQELDEEFLRNGFIVDHIEDLPVMSIMEFLDD